MKRPQLQYKGWRFGSAVNAEKRSWRRRLDLRLAAGKEPMKKHAPWSDIEVESLNEYQRSGCMHAFTAIDRRPDGSEWKLIATNAGWVRVEGGPVVQDWAHDWMCDGSWRSIAEARPWR